MKTLNHIENRLNELESKEDYKKRFPICFAWDEDPEIAVARHKEKYPDCEGQLHVVVSAKPVK